MVELASGQPEGTALARHHLHISYHGPKWLPACLSQGTSDVQKLENHVGNWLHEHKPYLDVLRDLNELSKLLLACRRRTESQGMSQLQKRGRCCRPQEIHRTQTTNRATATTAGERLGRVYTGCAFTSEVPLEVIHWKVAAGFSSESDHSVKCADRTEQA